MNGFRGGREVVDFSPLHFAVVGCRRKGRKRKRGEQGENGGSKIAKSASLELYNGSGASGT